MADPSASSGDYVFRYPLAPRSDRLAGSPDHVTELLRAQLANLLDLLVPLSGGREVKLDGFSLLNDPGRVHELFPRAPSPAPTGAPAPVGLQDPRNAALFEPRIDLIRAQLEGLLSVIELETNGEIVRPDGFRLRDLRDWVVASAADPVEVFGYAGARCDADCVFCYNKGNPDALAMGVPRRSAEQEGREMLTRLRYLSPEAGRALFPSLGSTFEVLAHPQTLDVLRRLRAKTPDVFRITTHGNSLTPDMIASLAELRPIYLYLSLNSATPARRGLLMGLRDPRVGIDALPLLRRHGIPYAAVIVPWPVGPVTEMLDDLSGTVAWADAHQAHLVQVNLPGYSRRFSTEKLFDLDEVWSAVVGRVRALRPRTSAPIVVMPGLYEENRFEARRNRPEIIGLAPNSPAARAGLLPGDEIRDVNGLAVDSRPQARHVLSLFRRSGAESATVSVLRDGQRRTLTVDRRDGAYPYSEAVDRHLGVVMMGTGFSHGCLERLRDVIARAGARRILFLSSALVKPGFEEALASSGLRGEIDVRVPANRFFGGNIFMGDLLVVQDFIDCIREYLANHAAPPDLVVIPSSPFNLGSWRRDLTGRVYLEIERATGIPVTLLDCDTIYE